MSKQKSGVSTIISSILITYLLASTLFQMQFAQKDNFVTITATAEKNDASAGTDCRIKSINLNNELVPVSELTIYGNWEYDSNSISIINPDHMSYLTFSSTQKNKLFIEFYKQVGSGMVEISCNGKLIDKIDLYSKDWEILKWEKQIPVNHSIFTNIPLFIVIFLCCLKGISLLTNTLKRLFQSKKEQKNLLFKVCILSTLLTLVGVLAVNYKQWTLFYLAEYSIIAWLILSVILINFIIFWYDNFGEQTTLLVIQNFILWFSPIVSFIIVETINDGSITRMGIKYLVGNLLVYYAIHFTIYILLNKVKTCICIANLIVYLFAVVNYFVTQFRGTPVTPSDFLIINTAVNVVSNYHYDISLGIYRSTLILISWISIPLLFKKFKTFKHNSRHMIVYYLFEVSLLLLISKTNIFNVSLDLWNLNNNIDNYGVAYSFIASLEKMIIKKPDGYSEEVIDKLYEEYKMPSYKFSESYPNIIVIMNEALSDLRVIDSFNVSEEFFPFIYSLEKNTLSGYALVSTLGGGTANTEYEFLTGNSMAFLPKGSLPYQQYINKKQSSLASFLLSAGYRTIAIHPYYADGYNRAKDYPLLGFEDFYDIKSFNNPKLIRNRYISDEESYKKIIDIYKAQKNNQPFFFFNVTMQNHSDYNTGYYKNSSIKLSDYPGKYTDAEEYLTLMKESDKAFEYLVSYFKKIEQPTIILMFGDHQPNLSSDFYEFLYQSPLDKLSLEETQQRYKVPFIIWANYEIDEQKNMLTSVNYLSSILLHKAGIKGSPYNNFLLKTSTVIPAMNLNGFLGTDQNWHTYDVLNEYSSQLFNYQYIQYNNVFSKNKNNSFFE